MGKLSTAWYGVRSTYWFLPSLMVMGALALHVLATAIDERVDTGDLGWLYTGGADGARALLSAVATSMITVAGVVFSITIVALTLASSQFGPRILRSFMRDTGNQVVLGTFIATFLYCLLVLRRIRGEESGEVVPAVSVTLVIA